MNDPVQETGCNCGNSTVFSRPEPELAGPAQRTSTIISMYCSWRITMTMGICLSAVTGMSTNDELPDGNCGDSTVCSQKGRGSTSGSESPPFTKESVKFFQKASKTDAEHVSAVEPRRVLNTETFLESTPRKKQPCTPQEKARTSDFQMQGAEEKYTPSPK